MPVPARGEATRSLYEDPGAPLAIAVRAAAGRRPRGVGAVSHPFRGRRVPQDHRKLSKRADARYCDVPDHGWWPDAIPAARRIPDDAVVLPLGAVDLPALLDYLRHFPQQGPERMGQSA